jgi:two-component system sensor histidine kinase YesM
MLAISVIPVIAFLFYSLVFVSSESIDTEISANTKEALWAKQYLESIEEQLMNVVYNLHIEENLLENIDSPSLNTANVEQVLRDSLYDNANLVSRLSVYSVNSFKVASVDYENGYSNRILGYNNMYSDYTTATGMVFFENDSNLYVMHTINDFETQVVEGVIVVRLDDSLFKGLDEIFSDNTNYFLRTSEHTLLRNNDIELIGLQELISNSDSFPNSGINTELKDYTVWAERVANRDLYVVSAVATRQIQNVNNSLISTGLIIVFFSLVTAILFSILLSNRITLPIRRLIENMKAFSFSNVEPATQDYDEIKVLGQSYNQMINEVNVLIQEKYKNEIDRKNAQLKALQAQINPHFLANTFQLIGGMALSVDATNIYEATIKMSNLVRYSMRINQESTTLKEELTHIQDYLSIQKLRFGETLVFDIDILDEVMNVNVPKFTLQPILENSFRHGLKNIGGVWKIKVYSIVAEDTQIIIEDNGKGLSKDKLSKINLQFRSRENYLQMKDEEYFSGIGLVNIDARLKLLYGERYGLELSSEEGKGVKVIITVPRKEGIK